MKRRLSSTRFLPAYVTSLTDRHGKTRLRFKRKGCPSYYFKAALGTEAFRVEYRQCIDQAEQPQQAVSRAAPGSIDDAMFQYLAVPDRLGPTLATQTKVRAVLEWFREGRGHLPIALVRFNHIEAALSLRRQRTTKNGRPSGGPEAARKLRKELVRFFDFTAKVGLTTSNPARLADRVRVAPSERGHGFHTWTEDEIATYRAHHALGTRARLAMELMLWTGQRRVDAIRMGRQHIRDGRIAVTQTKTNKQLWIPVAPQLVEAIVAMPPTGALCYLLTDAGKPFTNAGFGNWFREQCDDAGLPDCTAHGLRKAMMRRLAELHMGNQSLKSVSGHSGDDEVATYTRDVDQRRMADEAIAALSRWERGVSRTAAKANRFPA